MIRVVVVDDHPVARWGVEHLLSRDEAFEVLATAASLDDVPPGLTPDVVVLDLYLGSTEPAVDAVERTARDHRVLVVSASARRPDVVAVLAAGADGYLTKDAEDAEFLAAVRTVADGGFVLSSSAAAALEAHLEAEPPPASDGGALPGDLSVREAEALGWIARGYTHAQTAARMGISTSTVDSYVERIRRKLGLGNKAELTRKAIEFGLAPEGGDA